MAISVVNNTWNVSEEITTASGFSKTLATAGTFLDRNIKITATPKAGTINVAGNVKVTNTEQTIVLNSDTNQYNVNIQTGVTLTPTLTEGWISEVAPKNIIVKTTSLLDKTTLESGLTADNQLYRVSATKGYNEEKLSKDIDVFQGEITI